MEEKSNIFSLWKKKAIFLAYYVYFKKGKNTTEMQKKICAVYGEGAVIDRMHQKWLSFVLEISL